MKTRIIQLILKVIDPLGIRQRHAVFRPFSGSPFHYMSTKIYVGNLTNPLAKPTDKANPIVKTPAGDKTGNTTENEKAIGKKSLKITGLKIKRVKRAFVLTWKKNGNAVMYEIAYKKKGSKSYKRLKTVKATRVKTGKMKKKKYYYFKVRAVGKVNGSTEYGGWTTAKKVKCR